MEEAVQQLNSQQAVGVWQPKSLTLGKPQEQFCKEFANLPVKTDEELYNSQCIAVRQADKQAMLFSIYSSIGSYLSFVGLADKMNDEQIMETASMMIECQPNIPVDAVKKFFFNCKRGVYGKHYNRMDGSTLLQWFDQFCNEFFVQREEADYKHHLELKEGIKTPLVVDGEPVDFEELYAAFHGKTKEQVERERKVKDIRLAVCKKYEHLYNEVPVAEADATIENAIIEEMRAQGIINF